MRNYYATIIDFELMEETAEPTDEGIDRWRKMVGEYLYSAVRLLSLMFNKGVSLVLISCTWDRSTYTPSCCAGIYDEKNKTISGVIVT